MTTEGGARCLRAEDTLSQAQERGRLMQVKGAGSTSHVSLSILDVSKDSGRAAVRQRSQQLVLKVLHQLLKT